MSINWFTVIAQIVNFFILVWLLKRFLYKPILDAIDEREKKIASQLKDAATKMSEAENERNEFERKNKEFEQQKEERQDAIKTEITAERLRLSEDARKEFYALRSKLEKALQDEQEDTNRKIVSLTQKEVYAIAGKMLKELASSSLEENIINVFIRQLHELKTEDAKKLNVSAGNGVIIRTAFDVSPSQQSGIKNEITKIIAEGVPVTFEINRELVSGIELSTSGFKLTWNISGYINSIEKSIGELLKEKSGTIEEAEHVAG